MHNSIATGVDQAVTSAKKTLRDCIISNIECCYQLCYQFFSNYSIELSVAQISCSKVIRQSNQLENSIYN